MIQLKQIATLKRKFFSLFSLLIVQIVLSCSVVVLAFNVAFYLNSLFELRSFHDVIRQEENNWLSRQQIEMNNSLIGLWTKTK